MAATEMTTAEIPGVYRRFAEKIGEEAWKKTIRRAEALALQNPFALNLISEEYALSFQFNHLERLVARYGTVPDEACRDAQIYPAMAFAAQVLGVLAKSTPKQQRKFCKRVRNAFRSPHELHGLRLELLAATHFAHRGYNVVWNRTWDDGTFDLLIDGLGPVGLEVECKFASMDKGRRIHRQKALDFWNKLFTRFHSMFRALKTGLVVVITIPDRLQLDQNEHESLFTEVAARILGAGNACSKVGASVRLNWFHPTEIYAALSQNRLAAKKAIEKISRTENCESITCITPAGGVVIFVVQSMRRDTPLDAISDTLARAVERQFTGTRPALLWVALQGIDEEQLLSLHTQDRSMGQPHTALTYEASAFLGRVPDHVIGVVFSSRSSFLPVVGRQIVSGGSTYFFMRPESKHWHPNFRSALQLS